MISFLWILIICDTAVLSPEWVWVKIRGCLLLILLIRMLPTCHSCSSDIWHFPIVAVWSVIRHTVLRRCLPTLSRLVIHPAFIHVLYQKNASGQVTPLEIQGGAVLCHAIPRASLTESWIRWHISGCVADYTVQYTKYALELIQMKRDNEVTTMPSASP